MKKIKTLWSIKYQDKSRPVGANVQKSGSSASLTDVVAESGFSMRDADVVGVGNASLSQARIVFFAENDLDKGFHLPVGKWIDQHYKEGDVILVEGNGSAITDPKILESRYQIKSGCTYRRWGSENLREPRAEPFAVIMEAIASRLEKNIPKDSRWSDGLEAILRAETEELLKRFKSLSEIYKLDAATTQKYLSLAASLVDFLKTQRAMYFLVSPGTVFKMLMVTKVFSVFEGRRADDAHHSAATSAPGLVESVPSEISQNSFLIEAVKKNLKPDGKVFVILSMPRILEMGPSFASCKGVQEAVQVHPYIILTREEAYSKIANLNPQMAPQSFSTSVDGPPSV